MSIRYFVKAGDPQAGWSNCFYIFGNDGVYWGVTTKGEVTKLSAEGPIDGWWEEITLEPLIELLKRCETKGAFI